MRPVPSSQSSASPRNRSWLLIAALALTGLTMRTAVTSVGAALDDLQAGLHASGSVAGIITTLPVVCFAGLGSVTPRLSRRFGAHRLLVVALLLSAVGAALRPIGDSAVWFALLSLVALSGGAVSNVLLPSLVKEHFPDRIGAMTAVYSTALAVGTTAAAGLTVPIGHVAGGWRGGVGSWAVLRRRWRPCPGCRRCVTTARTWSTPRAMLSMAALTRSRTAWALTVFFAAQSMQAYISFGWFARFLDDHGVSHGTAGRWSPCSRPSGSRSRSSPRGCRSGTTARCSPPSVVCNLVAYTGMVVAPSGGAWVWMVLAGVGGGNFPVALTLIGLRARTAATTAALSAFVQAIGYIVAGTGPLLFGALFDATGSWALPMAVLYVALAFTLVAAGG